jgi:succinate dehydrogenase/fumarate reductase flavoprotein subunit
MRDVTTLKTEVLVVGGGAAGMFAALYASRNDARVILLDKNIVGRGGASIMAQMTCASALGEVEPDSPEVHLKDTLEAGRGLCNEALAALLCEASPDRIRELAVWNVDWARQPNGKINQVKAPGHTKRRCVYVDFLCTGAAICAALRLQVSRDAGIKVHNSICLTDMVIEGGEVVGAVGFDIATAEPVIIRCDAVILCSGGMMKLFQRTTAPNNNSGDGLGIALRAGANLIDIEFLQFYPNGHLAPRMVGLDPTTWEPTRVKLGGRLINGNGEEFLSKYGEQGGDGYNTTRDLLTHAIYREVAAGRGSPHGGVYLSFQHIPASELEKALGPVLDIFARNRIDLTKGPVEVFPIAHYQMGGIEVDIDMQTRVPGLYAAGEIVGGANGANRLSGNALPEAMAFGGRAGEAAARAAKKSKNSGACDDITGREQLDVIMRAKEKTGRTVKGNTPANLLSELKKLMWIKVGAFRTEDDLVEARDSIRRMRSEELDEAEISAHTVHNLSLVEWFELRNGLQAAEAVTVAANNRRESRGAHQRVDFPQTLASYDVNQRVSLVDGEIRSSFGNAAS